MSLLRVFELWTLTRGELVVFLTGLAASIGLGVLIAIALSADQRDEDIDDWEQWRADYRRVNGTRP